MPNIGDSKYINSQYQLVLISQAEYYLIAFFHSSTRIIACFTNSFITYHHGQEVIVEFLLRGYAIQAQQEAMQFNSRNM